MIWLSQVDNFNLWAWGGYDFVPFFVLPIRLGPVGLLALTAIFAYLPSMKKHRNLLFFISLIPLGFVLEQLSNYYPSILTYPSYRYGTLTFVGACVVASYGIIKALSNRLVNNKFSSKKGRNAVSALFVALLVSGFFTTTLYYVNASNYGKGVELSQPELNALNYVKQHLPRNASVLTFTEQSALELRNFAGVNPAQDAQRWSNHILSTTNPYLMAYILGLSNVKYIYITRDDAKLLNSNNILRSLIEHFPKALENDYATIYMVPPLTPPSSEASLGVLYFPPSLQGSENATWSDDSLTKGWYPYRQYGEVKNYESEVRNGIMKISVTSNQPGNTWASYALSGLSLNTTTYSVFSFRYRVLNNLTWFTVQLWNSSDKVFYYSGHQTSKNFTTNVVPLPENQIVTKIEIIVETVKDAPANTTAQAEIDYIKFSAPALSWKDDVFPALFASLLHLKYSVLYVDNVLMRNLGTYLPQYTHILLPSDPQIPVEALLNWVSGGNTLIVFNTHGNGFFANILGINASSPLLSIKDVGLGKVIYINLLSTNETRKESELLKPEFLGKVRETLTLNGYTYRVNTLPVYNSTFGNIEINGDLNISTDVLVLQGSVDLTNSPFPFDKYGEINVYGKVNLAIKNVSLVILPSESYVLIKPESYPVEGEVSVYGSKALIVTDKNIVYNSDMPNSFKFKTMGLSLYARLPSINASGTIIFDKLDVHVAPYIPLAGIVQQKAEIQGSVKFSTLYISNPITFFSKFQVNGKIVKAETTSRPSIPWAQVLTSPYNLAFNTIFLLGIVLHIIKKKRPTVP